MNVTFDTNTWQRVVVPHRFPNNPPAAKTIHSALKDGRVQGYISETVVTLEALPKGQRSAFLLASTQDAIRIELKPTSDEKIHGTIAFGGTTAAHPGMRPVLSDRLREAFEMGFRYIPVPRLGTTRPADFQAFEQYRIPLTQQQKDDIWPLLERIADVLHHVEAKGYGRMILERIATRIQSRSGMVNVPWYHGLDQPKSIAEEKEIDRAVAEWADGDTVAVHIGYGLDAICTQDKAGGQANSVFSAPGRNWLQQTYGVEILDLDQLAARLTQ